MLKRGSEATERQQGFCRKTGLQGLPTRVTLSLWAYSRQGATGVPLFTTWILWQARGEPQYLETFRAGARLNTQAVGTRGDSVGTILFTQYVHSRSVYYITQLVGRLGSDGFWKEDYGWGVRVSRPFGAR